MLASLTRPRSGSRIAGKQPLAARYCTGRARHGMPERHDRPAILAIARAIRLRGVVQSLRSSSNCARLIKIERSDLSKWQLPWANYEAASWNPPPRNVSQADRKAHRAPGHPGRRREPVHAQAHAHDADEYRRQVDLRGRRRARSARRHPHRQPRHRAARLGPAGAERAADHAYRALARRVRQAQHPGHHAQRLRRPRARARGHAARRQRVPAQADLAQGAARPPAVDPDQAARDGADRQVLRPRAAPLIAQNDLRHLA